MNQLNFNLLSVNEWLIAFCICISINDNFVNEKFSSNLSQTNRKPCTKIKCATNAYPSTRLTVSKNCWQNSCPRLPTLCKIEHSFNQSSNSIQNAWNYFFVLSWNGIWEKPFVKDVHFLYVFPSLHSHSFNLFSRFYWLKPLSFTLGSWIFFLMNGLSVNFLFELDVCH